MYMVDIELPENCLRCPLQTKCGVWVQIFDAKYDLKFMDIPTPQPKQFSCCLFKAKIPKILSILYYKWIKKECPHICLFCKHRKECKEEW